MAEIQREQLESDLLENLAVFDHGIQNRIDEIRAGLSPNGEHPNGLLSQAVEGDDRDDKQKFIDEYSWALSLAAYPHRNKENRDVLMGVAVECLFVAGETYDTETEPNFLRHLGRTVTGYLEEVFGEPSSTDLPSPEEFEEFVTEHSFAETTPAFTEIAPLTNSPFEGLVRLGSRRRLAAYRAGELTRRQLTVWAARFPDEVPTVNGELEWIGLALADLD